MNLQGEVIKICSEKTRLLPNKLQLCHRQELTFAMVEGQLYHIVTAIHQPYFLQKSCRKCGRETSSRPLFVL